MAVAAIYLFTGVGAGNSTPGSRDHAVDDKWQRGKASHLSGRQVRRVRPADGGSGARRWPVPADSVWIRQIATSSNVRLVAPEPGVTILGLTLTPDGNYVDYIRGPGRSALWRVPSFGGTPKHLLDDVWTPIGWSPDGRQMAFVRSDSGRGSSELVVAEADGGNAHVLTARQLPARFDSLSLLKKSRILTP